jgi:transcription antitermination factor NusG
MPKNLILDMPTLPMHGPVSSHEPSGGDHDEALISTPLLPKVEKWAVVWTKPRCERCVEEYFERLQVPCFLPRISRRQIYKSGVKSWSAPLFSGYIFYDQLRIERHKVFESRKVVDILVPPDPGALAFELSQIAMALDRDSSLREARFGQKGRPVRVIRGPMKGMQGEIVRIGGGSCMLVLRINFLGKAAELVIDESCVEPIL